MKKYVLCILMFCLLGALPAYAGGNGFYLGGRVMDSYQGTGHISNSGGSRRFDTGAYAQNTLGLGIFAGYDFFKKNSMPIRAEIEYALRSAVNTEYNLKRAYGAVAGGSLQNEYNMHTFFANLYYDFHNQTDFTPYVGGGIGLAVIQSRYEVTLYDTSSQSYSDSFNDTNTVFAYNLGLGCSYDFTDHITGDFGYRFVGTQYHETDKRLLGNKLNFGMSNYANEFNLGLRYNF